TRREGLAGLFARARTAPGTDRAHRGAQAEDRRIPDPHAQPDAATASSRSRRGGRHRLRPARARQPALAHALSAGGRRPGRFRRPRRVDRAAGIVHRGRVTHAKELPLSHRRLRAARPASPAIEPGIAAIRREMDLPDGFPPEVEAAARAAAANPRLPTLDRTGIPFVTIDPPGAMDLDQALHVERDGDGYVVHYAIADVGAFVSPGDPVDLEANRRGQTLYGANDKIPLHPKA